MNVVEEIAKKLVGKNYTDEEKLRAIYIESSKLFSYDPRYHFLKRNSTEKIITMEEIAAKEIDIHDTDDFDCICFSHSKSIMKVLLKELMGLDCKIKEGIGHSYVLLDKFESPIKMDATLGDLSRIKLGFATKRYNILDKNIEEQAYLREKDYKIGYLKDVYYDDYLQQEADNLEDYYLCHSSKDDSEIIQDKLIHISEEMEKFPPLSNYMDALFALGRLQIIYLNDFELTSICDSELYLPGTEWEYRKTFKILLENDRLYFVLEKDNDKFIFHETTYEDVKHYNKHMKGDNKII